ncbi:MAG: hypothetical protein GSR72_02990 [Desulfurococcales archaeon]|nr:hypothetical protein [Desulfurococcales archaeon]
MWWCFCNQEEFETLQSCIAEIWLQAQIRILRTLLQTYRHILPEKLKEQLNQALLEAESILSSISGDPVAHQITRQIQVREAKH